MNIYPLLAPFSVGAAIFLSYYLMKYIAKKMGKPFPSIGELMFPLHHKDSKLDKRYREKR